jgi:hypothetical protein
LVIGNDRLHAGNFVCCLAGAHAAGSDPGMSAHCQLALRAFQLVGRRNDVHGFLDDLFLFLDDPARDDRQRLAGEETFARW